MADIDVTRLVNDVDPFDLSASVVERGRNAGKETWANVKAQATSQPLEADEYDIRLWARAFGAWDAEEIAAMTRADLDALVLQFAAGDLREVQSLCPGDGLANVDWQEAERLASEGTIGGCLYAKDDKLYVSIDQ